MNYIQQTDVEHYMNDTMTGNGQNQFNDMLPRMQDMVDEYCNRTWNFTNPVTEYFNLYKDNSSKQIEDTFFPKYPVSLTPFDVNHPQAGGVNSIVVGAVNGQGGITLDLSYVYSYKSHIKYATWVLASSLANPFGYRAVQIIYNSDDATPTGSPNSNANVPNPIKQALVEWIARKIKTSNAANKEATRVQADSVHVIYKPDEVGGIPDFVKLVLDQYRLPVVNHF